VAAQAPKLAPQAPEFTVLHVYSTRSRHADRAASLDRVAIVRVGGTHVLQVEVPNELFSDETLRAAVRAELEEAGKWVGRSIPL
jgi:hypothetical protein